MSAEQKPVYMLAEEFMRLPENTQRYIEKVERQRDSLTETNARLCAQVAAMQAVVNAASILEQAVNSERQGSEDHYEAQLSLCDAVTNYRAALSSDSRGGGK